MGQRTQIVVKVTEKNTFENSEKTLIGCYHNQWGIAKMQLTDVIVLLNTGIGYKGFEFPRKLSDAWLLDEEETCKDTSIKGVIDYLNHMDNNDGGLLVELEIENCNLTGGKLYIFNDAEREEGEVNRVVSLSEYIGYWPRYYDTDFYTMFMACLRFHNIELMGDKRQ